ncbi:MAG TPA: xanthine dehydrogenase family protein molybdopterin-binding subunit, partial [Ktedonobacterales bacterium]
MPLRIMTTHLEFEGQITEQRFVMEGDEPASWGPADDLSVVGKPIPRVDGRERVTGGAKYTYDIQVPGMLYASAVRSVHPHARVTALDTSRAEAMPSVRAIFSRENAGELKDPNRGVAIFRDEVLYQGEEIALVVAETLEQAEDAVAAIKVTYEPLPFVTDDLIAEKPDAPKASTEAQTNVLDGYPKTYERGNVEAGLAAADATVELRVETPCAVHNSMETHGTVASWDGRTLVAYVSTQDLYGSRRAIAAALGLQQNQVNVICQYMGGGFGAKFGPHKSGLLAAYAAHRLGKPVHFMLSREGENLAAGNRAPTTQTYRAGAKKDGTMTALELRSLGNIGAMGGWYAPVALAAKELYQCPNVRTIDVPVRTNLGTQASFRAPGVVEGTVGLELMLDQLAYEIGMDPLAFRRKNYAENNQLLDGRPYAAKSLLRAYDIGAERIGWASRDSDERRYPRGRSGALRRGVGMASQIWGGDGGPPAQALAKLLPDGTAVIVTGTQDIGTGTRTVL